MRISLIQMDIAIGDPEANRKRALQLMEQAVNAEEKPDVILLPEMWNTGYALESIRELADRDGEPTKTLFSDFARKHRVNIIAGSLSVLRQDGPSVSNTIYAFNREGLVTSEYSKLHLFRLMDEDKYLAAGDRLGAIELDGMPAAALICYDIRFPELSRKLALDGAKVLFVPAEWPNPRMHHWRTLLMARAIENQMYVVACNRVGESRGTEFFGHSMIISPWGEPLAEAGEEETIVAASINLDEVDRVRKTIPVFEDRRPEHYI